MFVRVKVKVLVFDTRVAERSVSGEPEVAHVVGTFAPAFLHRDQALVLFSVVAAEIEKKCLVYRTNEKLTGRKSYLALGLLRS